MVIFGNSQDTFFLFIVRRDEIEPYRFIKGNTPLLVSMPHVGVYIPDYIKDKMTSSGLEISDTDWHLEALYDFLTGFGVNILIATHSRYVIDLNRDLKDMALYPGEDVTGLVSTTTFEKMPIYKDGYDLSDIELDERKNYWRPYHIRLRDELDRLKGEFGKAILWDAHSIKSEVPRFFKGKLPDFNFGTNSGNSETVGLADQMVSIVKEFGTYNVVSNGRFKGGYITRHYGAPHNDIHSIQLELSQKTYMEETVPFKFNDTKAKKVRPLLKKLITALLKASL
jgi:N-formylglutamate deformylase